MTAPVSLPPASPVPPAPMLKAPVRDPVSEALNAIAWVHFRLRGGWKSFVALTGGTVVVFAGMVALAVRANPGSTATILEGWLPVLVGFQGFFLTILGSAFISQAVRRDVTSRMIESHRLMPMSSGQIVFGYLTGGATPALALGFGVYVLGLVISVAADKSSTGGPLNWTLANGIVLMFSLMSWAATASVSLVSKGAMSLVSVLSFIAMLVMGANGTVRYVPGMMVLFSPLAGHTVFSFGSKVGGLSTAFLIGTAVQLGLTAIFFRAAANKFRRPHAPAYTVRLSFSLLATWCVGSVIGILLWNEFVPGGASFFEVTTSAQIAGSLICATILALMVLAASTWEHGVRRLDAAPNTLTGRPRRMLPTIMVTLLASLLVLLIPLVTENGEAIRRLLLLPTFAVVFAGLLAPMFLLKIIHRVSPRGAPLIVIWVVLAWAGPLLLDVTRYSFVGHGVGDAMTNISAASPVGALVLIWWDGGTDLPVYGIAAQWAIVAACGILLYATRSRAPRNLAVPAAV